MTAPPKLSSKNQGKGREIERSWSDLPIDITSLISSRILATDVFAFKATCRAWNRAISPLLNLPPPTNSPFFSSPTLLILPRSTPTCELFHSMHNKFYNMDLPDLMGATVHCSKHGWLLVARDEINWFFLNPITKAKMELPCSNAPFTTVGFSSPPTSLDCTVFGISDHGYVFQYEPPDSLVEVAIFRHGQKEWRYKQHRLLNAFRASSCVPIWYQGLFYCLDIRGQVGILDPEDIENGWHVHHKYVESSLCTAIIQSYMVEVDGQIFAVFVTRKDGGQVHVKKLRLPNFSWEPVQDLGDKMLYVSHSSSIGLTAMKVQMANKLYFAKLYRGDGVYYSLRSKKYHSFDGKCKKSFKLSEIEFGTWIELNA